MKASVNLYSCVIKRIKQAKERMGNVYQPLDLVYVHTIPKRHPCTGRRVFSESARIFGLITVVKSDIGV